MVAPRDYKFKPKKERKDTVFVPRSLKELAANRIIVKTLKRDDLPAELQKFIFDMQTDNPLANWYLIKERTCSEITYLRVGHFDVRDFYSDS